MPDELFTINSRKFDGGISRTWSCRLVERTGSMLTFVGEFDRDIRHPDLGLIHKGTVSYEYYWLDRWYNVFRFHEPNGTFRNYYCNINMPPALTGTHLDYVDLDIDIVVWPDLEPVILDQDEFKVHAVKFGYSPKIVHQVEATLNELVGLIEKREFPFGGQDV